MGCLDGRVAVITGGGHGLGLASALRLAREGARVAVADRDAGRAEQAATRLRAAGAESMAVVADVTSSADAKAMVDQTLALWSRLDILVTCAGAIKLQGPLDITDADWRHILSVNLDGTFYCCRAAAAPMMRQACGKIVTFSSIAGRRGRTYVSAHYAASKAGVIGLTMALASNLAPYNITVNCVAPGFVDTGFYADLTAEQKAHVNAAIPLGGSTPEDVAEAVLFLSSDSSRYVTGHVLDVCGGDHMG